MQERGFAVNTADVIFDVFDKEVVAIHMPTGTYHSLVGTAGDVFRLLAETPSAMPDLAAAIAAKYDASLDTICQDTAGFLEELISRSLVCPCDGSVLPARPAASNGAERRPYIPPALVSYADLQQLFLLDPVHDVSAAGWPSPAPVAEVVQEEEPAYCLAGEHVIWEKFEDETVVMNLGTGAYFSLYGPAEDILMLARERPARGELLTALASKYDIGELELAKAVDEFLEHLVRVNILSRGSLPEGSPSRALPLEIPAQRVPFSTLSLQIFGEAANPAAQTPGGEFVPVGQRRYRRRDQELFWSAAGGELVIIDRNGGRYYKLNASASDAFELLAGGCTVHETSLELGRRYEASERDLTAAVMILAYNLTRMRLIEFTDDAVAPASPANLAAAVKTPFVPFDIKLHTDLQTLLLPINVVEIPRPPASRKPATRLAMMLADYFAERTAEAGLAAKRYRVGGALIEVHTAAGRYQDLEKAWAHLAAGGSEEPALKIHVWDCSTPSEDPFLRALLDKLHANWCLACGPRGELLDFHCAETAVIYHPGPDVLSLIDPGSGNAYFLKRSAEALPYWEIGSPFRYILHFWFATRGLQFTHGGAVGDENGGVLIAGKGGAGKSTTAMLCTAAGMQYAGDDYCLVDPNGKLFSLYNTGKLCGPEDIERLPVMRGRSGNEDGFEQGGAGKGIYFLSEVWPDRMSAGFPLRAILLPSVTDARDTRLEPCSPGEALLALAPSTVAQLPTAGPADCQRMADLASKLPAWRLLLGSDLAQIPAMVKKVLAGV